MATPAWLQEAIRIDHQILHLEQQLWDLRCQRNALVPIIQLPNEVLTQILIELQHSFRIVDNGSHKRAWAPFMLICRRFREVALTCRTIWTHVALDQTRLEWLRLCLRRSGEELPLDVHWYLSSSLHLPHGTLHRTIHRIIPRAEHIQLHVHAPPLMNRSMYLTGRPHIPQLISLHISNNSHYSPPVDIFRPFYIEDDTVSYFPSLRHLTLENINIDSFIDQSQRLLFHLPNLTSLRIVSMRATLRSMELPGVALQKERKHLPVSLPCLTHLELSGTLIAIGQALYVLPDSLRTLRLHSSDAHDIEYDSNIAGRESRRFTSNLRYIIDRLEILLGCAAASGVAHHMHIDDKRDDIGSYPILSIRPKTSHRIPSRDVSLSVHASFIFEVNMDPANLFSTLSGLTLKTSSMDLYHVMSSQVNTVKLPLNLTVTHAQNFLPELDSRWQPITRGLPLQGAMENILNARVDMGYPLRKLTLIWGDGDRSRHEQVDDAEEDGSPGNSLPSDSNVNIADNGDALQRERLAWQGSFIAMCKDRGWTQRLQFLD